MIGDQGSGLDADRLAALGDGLADVVVVVDRAGLIRWANRAAEQLFGEPWQAWAGRSGMDIVHPDDLAMSLLSFDSVQAKQAGTPIEVRLRTPAGWRLMEVIGSHLDVEHLVLTMRDLTQRRRWEVAGDDIARFRAIIQHSASLTVLLRADGTVVSASGAVTRMLGHDPEDVCGGPFTDLVKHEDRPLFQLALDDAVTGPAPGDGPVTVEVRLRSRGGTDVPFELTMVSLLGDPTVEGLVVSGHDITRLRVAQNALEQLAAYDSLTGLFNRRSFHDALEREWLSTQQNGIDSYVVVIDLDDFKAINDRYGHAAGDDALRQVALALHNAVRSPDVYGRVGGDEFAVVLVRCADEGAAVGFVDRFADELRRRPWRHGAAVTASLGYQSLRASESPDAALHAADLAMLGRKAGPRTRKRGLAT
jgi:diguanylate cyclase (GGDEF)-like protein/PAS domain S-box-containing protein